MSSKTPQSIINDIYQAAFQAFEAGEPVTANPYQKSDDNHLRWLRAYNTAKCGSVQKIN